MLLCWWHFREVGKQREFQGFFGSEKIEYDFRLRGSKILVDGARFWKDNWIEWNEMKITVWKTEKVLEAVLYLRKELNFSKQKAKFVSGRERIWGNSCQHTSVSREAIGKPIFFELAVLGELESGHDLKKDLWKLEHWRKPNDLSTRNGLSFLLLLSP